MAELRALLFWVSEEGDRDASDLRSAALLAAARAYPGVAIFCNRPGAGVESCSSSLLEALQALLPPGMDEEQDSIALFYDWTPMLIDALCAEALSRHMRYFAHFTRSDNAPGGVVPDLVSRECVAEIGAPIASLREYVERNIEKLDVEFLFQQPDLRQYRLDFSSASARSRLLARQALAASWKDLPQLHEWLRAHPELLRPAPAFLEVELCSASRRGLRASYLPPPPAEYAPQMNDRLIDRLLAAFTAAPLAEDLSVSLTGAGEPLDHPRLLEVLRAALASPAVVQVFLESFGADLDLSRFQELCALPGAQKLRLIVRLSTLRGERYARFYGVDALSMTLQNLDAIAAASGTARPFPVYVEMLRLKETEDEVQAFFDRFEGGPLIPLLNKYNSYAGRLADRKAADLSPIERSFCWHLARDIYLNVEGRMPLCKQDLYAEGASQSLLDADIFAAFAAHAAAHAASFGGQHEQVGAPCLQCDEWFTFNA